MVCSRLLNIITNISVTYARLHELGNLKYDWQCLFKRVHKYERSNCCCVVHPHILVWQEAVSDSSDTVRINLGSVSLGAPHYSDLDCSTITNHITRWLLHKAKIKEKTGILISITVIYLCVLETASGDWYSGYMPSI